MVLDRQAAFEKVFLQAVTAYRLMSPPMLEPPMPVASRKG